MFDPRTCDYTTYAVQVIPQLLAVLRRPPMAYGLGGLDTYRFYAEWTPLDRVLADQSAPERIPPTSYADFVNVLTPQLLKARQIAGKGVGYRDGALDIFRLFGPERWPLARVLADIAGVPYHGPTTSGLRRLVTHPEWGTPRSRWIYNDAGERVMVKGVHMFRLAKRFYAGEDIRAILQQWRDLDAIGASANFARVLFSFAWGDDVFAPLNVPGFFERLPEFASILADSGFYAQCCLVGDLPSIPDPFAFAARFVGALQTVPNCTIEVYNEPGKYGVGDLAGAVAQSIRGRGVLVDSGCYENPGFETGAGAATVGDFVGFHHRDDEPGLYSSAMRELATTPQIQDTPSVHDRPLLGVEYFHYAEPGEGGSRTFDPLVAGVEGALKATLLAGGFILTSAGEDSLNVPVQRQACINYLKTMTAIEKTNVLA